MRAAIYTRVSSANKSRYGAALAYDQNPEVQAECLRQVAEARGWHVEAVYEDRASGSKEARPGLDTLLRDARRRRFDVVMVFRFDRLSRSVRHFLQVIEEFNAIGIALYSHEQNLDATTPMGKYTVTNLAALAELERDVTRERIIAGMEFARRHGTKSGQAIGRPRAIFRRDRVRELRDQEKLSWARIAREVGSTVGTIRRVYQQANNDTRPCQNPFEGT